MKKLVTNFKIVVAFALLFMIGFAQVANAQQVTVAGSTGADGLYNTLGEAINTIGISQSGNNITVAISASTTEANAGISIEAGTWASLKIYPTATGVVVSALAPTTDFLTFNGATNVTIDGRLNQTGASALTISSSITTAGLSNIVFTNNAQNNTIKYCTVMGSTSTTSGIITFSENSSLTNGNGLNTIDHNLFTYAGSTRPNYVIYGKGLSTSPTVGNIISDNNFENCFNKGGASSMIYILGGAVGSPLSSGWEITGNSFYETTNLVPTNTTTAPMNFIQLGSSTTAVVGSGNTISGNYIGGKATMCGGTAFTKTNAKDNATTCILLYIDNGGTNTIYNNTIKNISWSSSLITGTFTGIDLLNGNADITYNILGDNIIGSIFAASPGGYFMGIRINSITSSTPGAVTCNNNVIASITTTSNSGSIANSIIPIRNDANAMNTTINNNTIGSETENSINASAANTGTNAGSAQAVYGIHNNCNIAGATCTINKNTIANLTNASKSTNAGCFTVGVYSAGGIVSNNVIHNLKSSYGIVQNAWYIGSVTGIFFNGILDQSATGNTIYNLSNTLSTAAITIEGINFTNLSTSKVRAISGNLIYGLSVSAANTSASLLGIGFGKGITTCANNIISLGGSTSSTIWGINESQYSTGTGLNTALYHNTVYISGTTPDASPTSSYCFYSTTAGNTRTLKNNIFFNARSNGAGATGVHYSIFAAKTGLTCDYNDLLASGTGGWTGQVFSAPLVTDATFAAWKTTTGTDANSMNVDPIFENAGGTTANSYKPTYSSLAGATGTNVLTDFGGITRAIPVMGAWEVSNSVSIAANLNISTVGISSASDITITSGSTLTIDNNTSSIHNLTFVVGKTTSSSAKIDNALSVSGTVKLLKTLDNTKWYFMSFPCDVAVSEITLTGDVTTTLGANWWIKYYDGASRAVNSGTISNWKKMTVDSTLHANKGYIVGLSTSLTGDYVMSVPLNKSLVTSAESAKTVTVTAYGEGTTTSNHVGWNLVGTPYLSKFAGSGVGANYLTFHNGTTYTQSAKALVSNINPFDAFFVQANTVGANITGTDLAFAFGGRQLASSIVDVDLSDKIQLNFTSSTGTDNTNLIIDDSQSATYEINRDLEKWITTGTVYPQVYTQLSGINYVFNALPINNVSNLALGFYTKTSGTCTISANALQAPNINKLWLTDKLTAINTDLLTSNYSFNADAGTDNSRFIINIQNVPTGNLINNDIYIYQNYRT